MIFYPAHPAIDGLGQVIFRLAMTHSLGAEVGIAYRAALRTRDAIAARADRSRAAFAQLGYKEIKR